MSKKDPGFGDSFLFPAVDHMADERRDAIAYLLKHDAADLIERLGLDR